MKDQQTAGDGWNPGKQGLNMPLTEKMVDFLHTCTTDLAKAFADADNPTQMLNLLEEAGWTSNTANTKYATYQNRTRSLRTSPTREYRFSATFDSNGRLSVALREWWTANR
jgi:hypothetical protein